MSWIGRLILLAIACEALVQLWFHAAPLQGVREWIIKHTPFLRSEEQDTHLMECKYCVSVWAGILTAILYFYMESSWVMYIVLALNIHRLSNFLHQTFSLLKDYQFDIRTNRNRRD